MNNELEDFLQNNRENLDRKVPDPAVLNRILKQMQGKHSSKSNGILILFRTLRWVAACLILIACGIAFWMLHDQPGNLSIVKGPGLHLQKKNIRDFDSTAITSVDIRKNAQANRNGLDSVEEDLTMRKQALFVKMKSSSINTAKHAMYAGLNNMESSASRINAANYTHKLKNTGYDVVDALVETLNTDPSANVRLAALDGLIRFYRDGYVRKKLVASLKKQNDPVVQITLINLLTRMRESGILEELNTIINDSNTMKAVKDCAYSSIFRLRSS